MLELEQSIFWKIKLQRIEELILEHFLIQIDIIRDMGFSRDYFIINPNFENQILDKEIINNCLISKDYENERLDLAIWCLIMRNVLPNGKYLVSVF